jgi:hypothetical protein
MSNRPTDNELEKMTDQQLVRLMNSSDPREGGPHSNLPIRCYSILDRRNRTRTEKH